MVVRPCPSDAVTGVACSGHGSCLTGAGVCQCFPGYVGGACGTCGAHYVSRLGTDGRVASCAFLPGSVSTCGNGVRDGREAGVDCGGVSRCLPCRTGGENGGSGSAMESNAGQSMFLDDVTTVCAIAGVAVVAVVLVVVTAMLRRRRKRAVPPNVPPGLRHGTGSVRLSERRRSSGMDSNEVLRLGVLPGLGGGRLPQLTSATRASASAAPGTTLPGRIVASRVVPWS